jgi:exopolysaccharide production protein ExoZ
MVPKPFLKIQGNCEGARRFSLGDQTLDSDGALFSADRLQRGEAGSNFAPSVARRRSSPANGSRSRNRTADGWPVPDRMGRAIVPRVLVPIHTFRNGANLDRRMITNVQALRGIAALMVVIVHAQSRGLLILPFGTSAFAGGVDLFFVISGFIICTVATRDARPFRFAVSRFARIFPLYWTVLLVSFLASPWLLPEPSPHVALFRYFIPLALPNKFVPPAWSLAYEMYFYAVVAFVLIALPRRLYQVMASLMACQVALMAAILLRHGDTDASGFTSALVLEFGLGCGVAWIIGRGVRGGGATVGIFGMGLLATALVNVSDITKLHSVLRFLLFGTSGAALLYSLVTLELGGRLILPATMRRLGDASYSIYLWHWILLSATIAAMRFAPELWSRDLWATAFFAVTGMVSFVSYRFLEMPANRLMTALLRPVADIPRFLAQRFQETRPAPSVLRPEKNGKIDPQMS